MKRVITIILLILVLSSAFPQSQDQNYVETITFLNREESDGISSIQYYDCIGRASQSVIGGLNSSGRFAHIITEYDEKGRAYKNWSPILGQGNPEYIDSENIVSISQSTYNGDSRGFSEVEYDALEPEYDLIQAMIDARKKKGITQKELSELTGIAQGDISKLENGNANPSIRTLQRLASGMGMTLKVEFVPTSVANG